MIGQETVGSASEMLAPAIEKSATNLSYRF